MAFDLATGRQLWSDPVQNPYTGNSPIGGLAVAAGQAIVLTDDGIAGVSAQSGAQRWTLAPPTACVFEQLAASGDSAVAIAACDASYYVVSIDPATGKAAWQHHVTEPSSSYQFQILSASPVVISDDLTGPRGTSTVRVYGSDGAVTSDFSASGIPLAGGTVALNTGSTDGFGAPVAVADGMLVGATEVNGSGDAIAGYRLADGKRQWLVDIPDEVHDVALAAASSSSSTSPTLLTRWRRSASRRARCVLSRLLHAGDPPVRRLWPVSGHWGLPRRQLQRRHFQPAPGRRHQGPGIAGLAAQWALLSWRAVPPR